MRRPCIRRHNPVSHRSYGLLEDLKIFDKLIEQLKQLSIEKRKFSLSLIQNKIFDYFNYNDIKDLYPAFDAPERKRIFTLFLVMKRNQKLKSNLRVPKPLQLIITKESCDVVTLLNLLTEQDIYEIIKNTIEQINNEFCLSRNVVGNKN